MVNEEYNKEDVHYCKDCLSLKIRYIKGIIDSDYCDECGSTKVDTMPINEWINLYKDTYGEEYVEYKPENHGRAKSYYTFSW